MRNLHTLRHFDLAAKVLVEHPLLTLTYEDRNKMSEAQVQAASAELMSVQLEFADRLVLVAMQCGLAQLPRAIAGTNHGIEAVHALIIWLREVACAYSDARVRS